LASAHNSRHDCLTPVVVCDRIMSLRPNMNLRSSGIVHRACRRILPATRRSSLRFFSLVDRSAPERSRVGHSHVASNSPWDFVQVASPQKYLDCGVFETHTLSHGVSFSICHFGGGRKGRLQQTKPENNHSRTLTEGMGTTNFPPQLLM
jgi:hypothetical protein